MAMIPMIHPIIRDSLQCYRVSQCETNSRSPCKGDAAVSHTRISPVPSPPPPHRYLIIFISSEKCSINIRYGLVARISRSQTVVSSTTIRSEEAGVQFPVSESPFCFFLVRRCVLRVGDTLSLYSVISILHSSTTLY
jgi:hypothetical protein